MKIVGWVLVLAIVMMTTPGLAESPQEKGQRLITEADKFHAGFKDYQTDGRMILEDSKGSKAERELALKVLEDSKDGDDSIMVFSTPKDVKGTALLIDSHVSKDDDRWLYLPAVKRVKRIAAAQKSGPFLGSEFTYEDLTPRIIEKYNYKYLKEAKCGKKKCHMIESLDKDKSARFPKQVVYLSESNNLTLRVDYYDKSDKLTKTLKASGFKKYKGKHWAPKRVVMTNKVNGKKTTFVYSNYRYGNGFSKSDFSQTALKRIR